MPDYPVPDPTTGKIFIVTGDAPPTPEDVEEILVQLRSFNAPAAEPYTEPMEEPEPRRGMLGVAPEGVEMWNAAQAIRAGGKGLERGAPYLTGPLGAGAGGKIGAMFGMPFIGASLGAKTGHLARKPAEALGRGLQVAPSVAPWAGAVGLASEMTEDDGPDPLDIASLLGLGLTAFPPTSPLGMTLMTGSGLLGGAEQMMEGNTGAGALEMGLSALPFAGRAVRAIKRMVPTSTVPEAVGALNAPKVSGVAEAARSIPGQSGAAVVSPATRASTPMLSGQIPLPLSTPAVKLAPGAAEAVGGVGPGLMETNDVVDMVRRLEPNFLTQDVVRWPRPKSVLRSDESVLGLAQELARKQGTGVPTRLHTYPTPQGTTDIEKALRQRAHIASGQRGVKPTKRRAPAKKEK